MDRFAPRLLDLGLGGMIGKGERNSFEELGCELVKRLYIEKFSLIVAIDSSGGNIFVEGRKKYKENS